MDTNTGGGGFATLLVCGADNTCVTDEKQSHFPAGGFGCSGFGGGNPKEIEPIDLVVPLTLEYKAQIDWFLLDGVNAQPCNDQPSRTYPSPIKQH
jgi:hypothetical protein